MYQVAILPNFPFFLFSDSNCKIWIFVTFENNCMAMLYSRVGQSAARGPHAALQRFSAAPVSNFGYTSKLFMTHLCIKYPKFTSIMWSLRKKNKAKKKFLRPAIQYFNEIWPVRKKVWPPLLYSKNFDSFDSWIFLIIRNITLDQFSQSFLGAMP